MDVFEYLPQLIVAYDGNDEFANLIHVKKADKNNNYYCPCCGGIVKPRALDSTKEQSHYYHVTGKCTKESQLHFFCKNWLFEEGSKFYINDHLFKVDTIDIEKIWHTPFGDYKPDISVYTTSGETIFFELFFSNRKTGDDYFCKWDALGNDVVEVNIKEYTCKLDEDTIPVFTYLYHDGVCYLKPYVKKDLYATTIARIKRELIRQKVLNYKARIEQLDWFWQKVRNNESRESILDVISNMEYNDMLSCYEIIKRKQCVSYLKEDILNTINKKVVSNIRESIGLPYDENVYFDLEHVKGRTYNAGIRLNIKTNHIIYNDLYGQYLTIVFSKDIFCPDEIKIFSNDINMLKKTFRKAKSHINQIMRCEKDITSLEETGYKVKVRNNYCTVLEKSDENDKYEVILENYYLENSCFVNLSDHIQKKKNEDKCKAFISIISDTPEYRFVIDELQNYRNSNYKIDIYYDYCNYDDKWKICLKLYADNTVIYYGTSEPSVDDFVVEINKCKNIITSNIKRHSAITELVNTINDCKNNFWTAEILHVDGHLEVKIDQKIFKVKKPSLGTYTKVKFYISNTYTKEEIIKNITNAMYCVFRNMERCGYRVMEVLD